MYPGYDFAAYPVEKVTKTKRTPYAQPSRNDHTPPCGEPSNRSEPSRPSSPEQDQNMEEDIQPDIESKKKHKLRLSKKYDTNVWDIIKKKDAGLTIGEVMEVSNTAHQQVRNGLANTVKNQKHEVLEITSISQADKENQKSTSAYTSTVIEDLVARIIPDTGAAFSIITWAFINHLGWKIEKSSPLVYTITDGQKATSYGYVLNVSFRINNQITIVVPKMVVTDADTYDVLWGVDTLQQFKMVMDMASAKLRFNARNKHWKMDLVLNQGIWPKF